MKQRGLAWLLLILGFVLTRWQFCGDAIYNIDEAEYAVAADALAHGWLPGVDLLGTTKPPGIALLYAALFSAFGHSLAVVHVAHVVIMIFTGALLVELGIALWGLAAALPVALFYWMASSTWNLPQEMLALNVESPGVLLAMLALLIAWRWPRSLKALLLAGAAAGGATIFRQSFIFFLLPLGAAVWLVKERREVRLWALGAGVLLPWLPVLALYAAHGGLGWAVDSWVRYPMTYAQDTGLVGFLLALYLNFTEFATWSLAPLLLAIGGVVLLVRERQSARAIFMLTLLAASLLALFSGSRFFGHYWLQLFPALALVGTGGWLFLARRKGYARWALGGVVVIGTALAALHFPLWRTWDSAAPPQGASFAPLGPEHSERTVAAWAREHTTSEETIAVWGYCPQIYYLAGRLPGVRDYLCHYVTGYSPGTFDPQTQRAVREYGHPQAEQMFIDDLESRQPKYIFDLVGVEEYEYTFVNYSLRTYPDLAAYLRQHYGPELMLDSVYVYRRLSAADSARPVP